MFLSLTAGAGMDIGRASGGWPASGLGRTRRHADDPARRRELLKLRRRWASYVVLGVLLGLMALIYLLIGLASRAAAEPGADLVLRFPDAYGVINQFVFGLGSLLAVAYAAAIGGADWNWGVLRVVVARGEGRSRYILAKAFGIAIVLVHRHASCAYAAGVALTFVAAALAGVLGRRPARTRGQPRRSARSLGLRHVRAARSAPPSASPSPSSCAARSPASWWASCCTSARRSSRPCSRDRPRAVASRALDPADTQWFQFLPFSIGDSVLIGARGVRCPATLSALLLQPVPLGAALVATAVYLVDRTGVAVLATERAEIA